MKQVWPDTFVEEGGLARNISALRKALGSDNGDDAYIETIARRGYRFVATVKEVEDKPADTCSLAVLPMANLSNDPAQDFFADGMTDELISYLMKIETLRISSRTSVMAYKNVPKSLQEIARELNVRWVVEGTVLQSGGRVRIAVRLIDGANERHLWSTTYEKGLHDVLALQSDVASDIAREIRVKLTLPAQQRLATFRTVNPEAYEDYLRGRYFWNIRTIDGLRRARQYFEEAIERDPTYAPAHTGLADALSLSASTGYDLLPPREAMPHAKAAALAALRIDNSLAEAYAALGHIRLAFDWDWTGAERDLRRAIALNPTYAASHQWLGELLLALNRPDEAVSSFRRAVDAEPLGVGCNLGLGWAYYFSEQYGLAIQQLQTLEIGPNVPMCLYGLLLAYHHKKDRPKELVGIQDSLRGLGDEPAVAMLTGVMRGLLGMREAAAKELSHLRELSKRRYVPAVYSAFINFALQDNDAAFEFLEQACEERSSYLIFLNMQPALEPLRSEPRYRKLVQRIGLP